MTPAQPARFARFAFTWLAVSASAHAWAANRTADTTGSISAPPTPDLPRDAALTTAAARLDGVRYPASIETLQGKDYNDSTQLVAAHLLSAPDPSAALAQHYVLPLDLRSPQAQADAQAGQRRNQTPCVLRTDTISATPILVFKDRAGKTFSIAAEAALPHLSAITQVQP